MTDLQELTVALTACNGLVSPSQINGLRSVDERSFRIVGTDARSIGAGSEMVDEFRMVPEGHESGYVDRMIEICEANGVDALLPASDSEVLRLSAVKDRLTEIGTSLVANDNSIVEQAGDKGTFLELVDEAGLPCAGYQIPTDLTEFQQACHELGYPEHPVVMKPRLARGNRGMRIIKSDIARGHQLLHEKPGQPYVTLEEAKTALSSPELVSFPDLVVMEYLPGEEYSVDVLAKDGTPVISVPKRRVETVPGLSVVGEVDLNQNVIQRVAEICDLFGFDYNVNVQLRAGRDGRFYPYEINPRIAASIDACRNAGANLLYFGVKLALGETIPDVDISDGLRMIRYYSEQYTGSQS